jgi:4-amino-4-deoxy-L-arabinose transferase-like glycosyltransferase
VAGSFSLLGIGIVPLRIVAALAGTAVIPLFYLLGQRLFHRRVGLLAAALVACSFWPIFDSRIGLRASLIPPLTCALVLALLSWQRQPARAVAPIAAGILLGLSLHTYTPGRVLPLVPIVLGIWMVTRQAVPWPTVLRGLVLMGTATAVIASPLVAYFIAHPAAFAERAGQVNDFRFILSEGDFGPLLRDTLNTLGMFTFGGDPFDRYNLAGRPVFDPLAGLGFYGREPALPAGHRRPTGHLSHRRTRALAGGRSASAPCDGAVCPRMGRRPRRAYARVA